MNHHSIEGRLHAAYQRGLVVPFLGAGMSHDSCPLWEEFIARLEQQSGAKPSHPGPDLVQRAAWASRRIRNGGATSLAQAVRAALASTPKPVTRQLQALARIRWPLVITTNYDDLFLAATCQAQSDSISKGRGGPTASAELAPMLLLGRSPSDCQRILMALRRPEVPILWALQGYVGGQAAAPTTQRGRGVRRLGDAWTRNDADYRRQVEALEEELVVGHAEYRRVALSSEPFRRAFAEVYRHRSFLFVGSGLAEAYFRDLFSEIIELHGPSPLPHFAYLKKGQVDPGFLRDYFGIWVIELEGHDELPERLAELGSHSDAPGWRQMRWTLGKRPTSAADPNAAEPAFTVVHGGLPSDPGPDGCLVVSAGGTPNRLHISRVGTLILQSLGYLPKDFDRLPRLIQRATVRKQFRPVEAATEDALPLWQHREFPPLLAINARLNPWSEPGARLRPLDPSVRPIGGKKHPTENARTLRDVRIVDRAIQQVIAFAQSRKPGFRQIHSMLLAAGENRTFARSVSLLQMLRGWTRSQRRSPGSPSLTVYVVASATDVLLDLQSGRLDLQLGLEPDWMEFWAEVRPARGVGESYLRCERADKRIIELAEDLNVAANETAIRLTPPPTFGWAHWTIKRIRAWERLFGPNLTLERFGVLPGSIVEFSGAPGTPLGPG